MKNSIEAFGIVKKYKESDSIPALNHININVQSGELFGLIGPDGAGKTTLFRILTTLLLPNEGKARVMGFDIEKDFRKIRKITGYMPGKFSLYQDLSVWENLTFFATLFDTTIEENYHLIEDIFNHLAPFKKRKAGDLSGGMKQKLALCCALVHKPEVLFLDEPTTGVDAVSRKEFWEMLKRLKEEGITIFVSTPYMDEATLCDRIALIQEGRLLSTSNPQELIKRFEQDLYAVRSDEMYSAYNDLVDLPGIKRIHTFGAFHHLQLQSEFRPESVKSYLHEKGHKHVEIKLIEPTIEDCFMELMTEER